MPTTHPHIPPHQTRSSIGFPTVPSIPFPNPFLLPGATTLTPIYFGKKRFELNDWLGNVRVVVNDKKTPVNSGSVTVSYKPQVVSVSDYYSFGSQISERSYDPVKPLYRYGFNTQEKTFELNKDHYTAKFWEYDSRLGRRWNVDPKPTATESYYACFSNNPLMFSDVDGDTTYIYNTKGIFKGIILDKLKHNEIVIMNDIKAKAVLGLIGKYSNEIVAKVARDPKMAYARITYNTAKELLNNWTKSKQESLGLLYRDNNTKEVHAEAAKPSVLNKVILGGEADARELVPVENKIKQENKGEIIGMWHTHPENTFQASQPSSQDFEGNKFVDALQKGGIGVIVQKKQFSIYPLFDFKNPDWLGTSGNDENKDKRVFPSQNHRAVFNKELSPQYTNKK